MHPGDPIKTGGVLELLHPGPTVRATRAFLGMARLVAATLLAQRKVKYAP